MAFMKYCKMLERGKKAVKINGNTSKITIPAGVETEQQIKIRNLGGKDVISSLKEDLHCDSLAANQKKLTLKKHNLYPTLTLDFYIAIFTNAITAAKFATKVKLFVKPETQNGIKGFNSLKEKRIISFTAEMMNNSVVPILSKPEKYKFKLPKKITPIANFKGEYKIILQLILHLNQLYMAKIYTLDIYSGIAVITAGVNYEKYKKTIKTLFRDFVFTFKKTFEKNVLKTFLEEKLFHKPKLFVINPSKKKEFFTPAQTKKRILNCYSITNPLGFIIPFSRPTSKREIIIKM